MNLMDVLKKEPKKWPGILIVSILIVLLFISFDGSSINWTRIQNLQYTFGYMLDNIWKLNFDFLFGLNGLEFENSMIYLTLETFAIGFLGTLLGAILAIPFGFLAAENIVGKKIAKISEAFLVLIRVFPEIVLAIILVKGFGLTALAGVLTIGLHSIGMLGKLFAESIDNMDRAPLEALDAVGANIFQKIRYGVIPQIAAEFSSITLYRLDINVRSATILGLVGAGGIGTPLILAATNWSWSMLGTILFCIIIMIIAIDYISSALRKKLI